MPEESFCGSMALSVAAPPHISAPPRSFFLPLSHFSSTRFHSLSSDSSSLFLATYSPTSLQNNAPCSQPIRMLDKVDLFYQRLCSSPIEDVQTILESAQQELPLVELRSIVDRFDENGMDMVKSIRVIQWAKKQKYFQPYDDAEMVCSIQKEQVEMILMEFLRSIGLSNGLSTRITRKSGRFIEHLHSILFNRYRLHYTKVFM